MVNSDGDRECDVIVSGDEDVESIWPCTLCTARPATVARIELAVVESWIPDFQKPRK